MKDKQLNRSQNNLELRDIDTTKGVVDFIYIDTNTQDDRGTYFSLDHLKTITLHKRMRHFKNHDITKAIGKPFELGVTDGRGWVRSQLANYKGEYSSEARNALIEYQSGLITEHSFGFYTLQSEYDKTRESIVITEFEVMEFSSLTHWGSNQNTPTQSVRSAEEAEDLATIMNKIEKMVQTEPLTDERAVELMEKYESIKKAVNDYVIRNLIKNLK